MDKYYQSKAIESTVLNLLASSARNYDYPTLQHDAVELIASNITDIVYGTLKQKSSASTGKRCDILKFLNNICQIPEFHNEQDHYKTYLKVFKQQCCMQQPEVQYLLHSIARQLNEKPTDTRRDMLEFYSKKNGKTKSTAQKKQFIKNKDQEGLMISFQSAVKGCKPYYETSESLINELFKTEDKNINDCQTDQQIYSKDFREEQVQFCYALTHLATDSFDVKLLEHMLHRYSLYDVLYSFEKNLLLDLWMIGEFRGLNLSEIITENYAFAVENVILGFCTEILQLKEDQQVGQYFRELTENAKFKKLQEVCSGNRKFYYQFKNYINQLYVFSYCNQNIDRFLGCIN